MYHDKAKNGSGVGSADNNEEGQESGSPVNEDIKEEPGSSVHEEAVEADKTPVAKPVIKLNNWLVFPTYQPDWSVFVQGFEGDSKVCLVLCDLIDV